MQYMTLNSVTIQMASDGFRPPPMEQTIRSELYTNGFQAPLTIGNLRRFIEHPWPSVEDKLEACMILYDKLKEQEHVQQALIWKSSTEKVNGLHCKVYEPSDNVLEAYFGLTKEPLQHLEKYVDGYKPFSQQLIGAWFIERMKRCEILYDMRVGKTLTAIIAAKRLLEQSAVDHIIVVCPKPILESVWQRELSLQNLSSYGLVNGEQNDDNTVSYLDCDAYCLSFESLVQRLDIFQKYMDMERIFVIVDETSFIKNPVAKRTKAVMCLTFWAKYVVFLTGTPMTQGPQDFFSQRLCIDRGETFGSSYSSFFNRFCTQYRNKVVINSYQRMAFELAIQSKSLRYVRSEADQFSGKDKNFRYIRLAPTVEQVKATENALAGFVELMEDESKDIKTHILVLYGYLREICCGYNKIQLEEDGPYSRFRFEYDSKTLWLETFLESNPGVPLIVYSEFDEHEQIISEMLERVKIPYIWYKRDSKRYGDAECVRRFQEGDVRVILLKSRNGYGHTFNRVEAVNDGIGSFPAIVYMEPTWSLIDFLQSQDRAVGTYNDKNICTPIYVLSVKKSIEDKIIEALRKKQDVQQTLLKDVDREGFYSFINELRLDLSVGTDDDTFDPEEMHSRRVLGISPQLNVSHKKLEKLVPGYLKENGIYDSNSIVSRKIMAARYLYSKYNPDGTRRQVKYEFKTAEEEFDG